MISFDTTVDTDFPVYSRAHTAVVLPGVLSPLAWTLLGPALETAHRITFCRRFGLMPWPRYKEFLFVGRFGGRLYQNVTVLEAIAVRGPGSSPVAELGLEGTDVSRYQARWTDRLWTVNSLSRGALAVVRLRAWTREGVQRVEALRSGTDRVLARADPAEIAGLLEQLRADLPSSLALNGTVRSLEMAAVATVQQLLERRGVEPEIAAALLSGLPGLEGAQPSLRLRALAHWVASTPDVLAAIASGATYAELRAATSPGIKSFLERFLAFQADFGHRGIDEADPTAPAWEQQPDVVLGMIRGLLAAPERDPLVGLEQRRAGAERIVRGLPLRHRLPVLTTARIARGLIARAEITKSVLIRHVHQLRRCLWALRDQIGSQVDAASFTLLTWDELSGIVAGVAPPSSDELSRRRLELDGAAAIDPPLVFDGVFRSTVADLAGVTDILVGVGAAPGAASGPAVVVLEPTDPPPPGSVLVAPATDTAWTPLFLAAAAVVTDLGSFMSHSSIVARELGIAAVVNTGTATRTIRSGQPTRVDGDRGLVFLGGGATG